MKKIPSLFVREYEQEVSHYEHLGYKVDDYGNMISKGKFPVFKNKRFIATNKVTHSCEWVINGEGVATRKWDGIAVNIQDGILYKRYDAKHGKIPPHGFVPCQEPDMTTGHWPGWIECFNGKSEDKYIIEAYRNTFPDLVGKDGTYEAIGPKINGNNDKWDRHELRTHGDIKLCQPNFDYRSYYGIKSVLQYGHPSIEGIVFHHPDGRMCKVKRSDFGLKW